MVECQRWKNLKKRATAATVLLRVSEREELQFFVFQFRRKEEISLWVLKCVLEKKERSERRKGRINEIYQFVDPSHLFGLAIMKILVRKLLALAFLSLTRFPENFLLVHKTRNGFCVFTHINPNFRDIMMHTI